MDSFSRAVLWFVIGVVVMGLICIGIDARTHSNIEYCSTPIVGCQVWVKGIDSSSCKILIEQLNKPASSTSFYICR